MLAHVGFKAGCIQVVSIDDREKTPNHGKQLVSLGTVLVTPPVTIIGLKTFYAHDLMFISRICCKIYVVFSDPQGL